MAIQKDYIVGATTYTNAYWKLEQTHISKRKGIVATFDIYPSKDLSNDRANIIGGLCVALGDYVESEDNALTQTYILTLATEDFSNAVSI